MIYILPIDPLSKYNRIILASKTANGEHPSAWTIATTTTFPSLFILNNKKVVHTFVMPRQQLLYQLHLKYRWGVSRRYTGTGLQGNLREKSFNVIRGNGKYHIDNFIITTKKEKKEILMNYFYLRIEIRGNGCLKEKVRW